MSLPVRCFTCGKVIGIYEEKFEKMLSEGIEMKEIFKSLRLERYCCRRMFLGYVNIVDQLLPFSNTLDKSSEQNSKCEK